MPAGGLRLLMDISMTLSNGSTHPDGTPARTATSMTLPENKKKKKSDHRPAGELFERHQFAH